MRTRVRCILAVLGTLAALANLTAHAQSPSAPVRFAKLYSTLDGEWQAIELDIGPSGGAPLQLGGRTLTFRDVNGRTRSQVLPATWDGPVIRGKLLLANEIHDGWNGVEYGFADLKIDRHIVPIDGGTVTLEGIDSWTFGPLPLDGRHALARDGTPVRAILSRYFEAWKGWLAESWDHATVLAREYRHAALDRYLLTARVTEIDALESGAIEGWSRTGKAIEVFARPQRDDRPSASSPVCRFMTIDGGGASHFLSPDRRECDLLAKSSTGVLEASSAFHVSVADPLTGACPDKYEYDVMREDGSIGWIASFAPMVPVYRLWNGHGGHRLVQDAATRNAMVADGWVAEGYGPDPVMFCTQ